MVHRYRSNWLNCTSLSNLANLAGTRSNILKGEMMAQSPNPFEGKSTLWVVHIGNDNRIAQRARDEGFVCIGWTDIGDLTPYDTRDKMRAAMEKAFPAHKPKTISATYGQTFNFAHEMAIGDPVVLPVKPTGEIAIGRVSGPYLYASSDKDLFENDYASLRPIEWLKIVPRTAFTQAALHSFGSFSTVSTSNDHLEEVLAVLSGKTEPLPSTGTSIDAEPEEDLTDLYESATQETEDYLLKSWKRTGHQVDHVVAATFEAMGYYANVTQASGDHGVDVIAHPDPLGLEQPFIKIQTKSGSGVTNEEVVNQLRGTLQQGEHGVVVSLGGFTKDALHVGRTSANLKLIDDKEFVSLFLEHYDDLDPAWRSRYPLRQVFVPFK